MQVDTELLNEYIHAYGQGDLQKGRELIERVSISKEDKEKNLMKSFLWDAQFYLNKSPSEHIFSLKPRIFTEASQGQRMFAVNPFIVQDQVTKCYIVGIRILNYAAKDGLEEMVVQGKIHTHYEIFIFEPHMKKIIEHFPLSYEKGYNDKLVERDFPYATGTEDYRVIPFPSNSNFSSSNKEKEKERKDLLQGYCTGIETHKSGPIRMCSFLLTIQRDEKERIKGLMMHSPTPLVWKENDNLQQKNWVPLMGYPNHVVYSCTPLTILSYTNKGECSKSVERESPLFGFRNGSPFIPFTVLSTPSTVEIDGWLTLSHTSVDHIFRVYYHRFLFFDRDFKLIAFSPLFYFEQQHTIEFASGLVYNEELKCFFITFGFRDRYAHIHKLPLNSFLDRLIYV